MRQAIRAWRDQGIRVEPTHGGHLRLLLPNGHIVIASGTPSDPRALKNILADIRRNMRLPTRVAE